MVRLLVLGIVLLAFSGCRIGNYEKDQPGFEAADGFYETAPTGTIQMCGLVSVPGQNGTNTKCQELPSSHIDGNLDYIVSNPVRLQYDSADSIFSLENNSVTNPDDPGNLRIAVAPISGTNEFYWQGGQPLAITPMPESHSDCLLAISTNINGSYTAGGTFNSGSNLPITGRISMTVFWDYTPVELTTGKNDCSYIANCYNDSTQCTANDQQIVKSIYEPFFDTNTLQSSDLPNVQGLEYQVSYQ